MPDSRPIIFTPDNEPYLGREALLRFDQMIVQCLNLNSSIAPRTHDIELSDLQRAACQLVPQAINITLSIRELIRQGYLFGAMTLARPLVERASILLYLNKNPDDVAKWNRGWEHRDAPSLAKMLENITSDDLESSGFKGHEATAMMNAIIHGKPDCAVWSLVPIDDEKFGHGVSKILENPKLCDEICMNTIPWLLCVFCMMTAYFPESNTD